MLIRCTPSVEKQHFVTYTVEGVTETSPVYAESMEVAIKEITALFAEAASMAKDERANATMVRAATEGELPWNLRRCLVATKGSEIHEMSYPAEDYSVTDALMAAAMTYEGFDIRIATPAEAERMCREHQLYQDLRTEEEIGFGFQIAKGIC